MSKVLVLYYSSYGHIEATAIPLAAEHAFAAGAKKPRDAPIADERISGLAREGDRCVPGKGALPPRPWIG